MNDMKKEEGQENMNTHIQNYTYPRLLGFLYNTTHSEYSMVRVSPPEIQHRPPKSKPVDCVFCVLNSSNGMILTFMSTYLKKSSSIFYVNNPQTQDIVRLRVPPYTNFASPKRFLVYGFYFDPHCPYLCFTIVEISDTSYPRPGSLLVNVKCTLDTASGWRPQKVHSGDELVRLAGENFVLSGTSTYLHGALHWLVEPSGVIAYHLGADCFKFNLINIPGDTLPVNTFGLCSCLSMLNKSSATSTTSVCNCRYLGESRDKLVYARITGDYEFSVWILEDYHAATWSNPIHVQVNCLRTSLFGGRVLAFSRSNPHLVFLRVRNTILSYDCMTREHKKIGIMEKKYKGDDRWDGFVVPFEVTEVIPMCRRHSKGFRPLIKNAVAANMARADSVQLNQRQNCSNHRFAITQLAKKVLANNQPQEDDDPRTTEDLPFRSLVFLYDAVNETVRRNQFSELIRLEAAVYGSIGRLVRRTNILVYKNHDQIPVIMLDFIDDYLNVVGDGNCGFRVVADVILGDQNLWRCVRNSVINELLSFPQLYEHIYAGELEGAIRRIKWDKGPCGIDHWMESIPDFFPIATFFNARVILLTTNLKKCCTVLPLRAPSTKTPLKREIVIGHIKRKRHAIRLHMFPNSPVPPISHFWKRYHDTSVDCWDRQFLLRRLHWDNLVGR